MSEVLLKIGGVPVFIDYYDNGKEYVYWTGEMTIDADGSPRAYGPSGTKPLDYLANAGSPGNWWGIATDNQESDGVPIVQGTEDPWPGYYVSTTAYLVPGYKWSDPRRYLDSEAVLFTVVPGNVRKATVGICKGCRARVTDKKSREGKGKAVECVIGDVGPSDHMGEASIALARFFGVNPNPKSGGSSDKTRFQYEMWPGVAAKGYALQS
jgi:hypothetical protein